MPCSHQARFGSSRDHGSSLTLQAFAQFDAEGDGTVDAESMLEALKHSSGANLQGELSHTIRQLQACSLVPGKAGARSRGP